MVILKIVTATLLFSGKLYFASLVAETIHPQLKHVTLNLLYIWLFRQTLLYLEYSLMAVAFYHLMAVAFTHQNYIETYLHKVLK